ncbi:uncharacterized protein RCC_05892 [Ramularia collo-cygni]|uniref:Uncharacterized protein n=1 Tax=Ramularia collo-cygni TaxID=112498 RepID=A0A2D3V000_9PEZI|nr:uncharacterized protein RCC_05892 [Ramularia collo-cygni]CZT20035.1 uncharacterized protein RCC_05892 [Ramularia collo-cygni]
MASRWPRNRSQDSVQAAFLLFSLEAWRNGPHATGTSGDSAYISAVGSRSYMMAVGLQRAADCGAISPGEAPYNYAENMPQDGCRALLSYWINLYKTDARKGSNTTATWTNIPSGGSRMHLGIIPFNGKNGDVSISIARGSTTAAAN